MADLTSARKSNNDHRRGALLPAGADGFAVAEAVQRSGRIRPEGGQPEGPGRVRGGASDSPGGDLLQAVSAPAILPATPVVEGGPDWLVTCATTARITSVAGRSGYAEPDLEPDRTAAGRGWVPRFPTTELVQSAAALWDVVPWDGKTEGPHPAIIIGPGVISIRWHDLAKRVQRDLREERRREIDRAEALADLRLDELIVALVRAASWMIANGHDLAGFTVLLALMLAERRDRAASAAVQLEWSRRSVARMVERLASLDWSPVSGTPWAPAAIALTYPGGKDDHWLELAPDGETAKRHLRTFEKRFYRAWGFEPVWVWKMEFQRRGAPHFHLLAKTPKPGERAGQWRRDTQVRYRPAVGDDLLFREWVAVVWADVVGDPDPVERQKHIAAGTRVDYEEGARCRDPKRAAVYFTKHGTFKDKWYQNVVPEAWREPGKGPGRFWGYKGLEPSTATVLIDNEDAVWAKRLMRRWSRAQDVTRQVRVQRVEQSTGLIRARKVRRRAVRLGNASGGGFLCVNDAAAYSSQLVRAVELARRPAGQGGLAPLRRRDKYLSGVNAVMVELHAAPLSRSGP